MTLRKPVHEDLPDAHRRLLDELWRLKGRHSWTFAQLARKTGYSATSWHRYLSGRTMPPWEAVDALGRLAAQEDGRLRALWEVAAAAAARRSAPGRTGPLARDREAAALAAASAASRSRSRAAVLGGLLGTTLLLASSLALLSPWGGGRAAPQGPAPQGAPSGQPEWPWPLPIATGTPAGVACLGDHCRGRDPYRLGCDRGSVPVHALTAHRRTLTLWYSPVCRAVWAEVVPGAGTSRLTVSDNSRAVTAPAGDARTGMLGTEPGQARGSVNLPGCQLGVDARTSWVVDQ
ncbi:helix-turn-helix domain-containing protein [Streptomyces sp. NPDC051987]|uniref:helix-turn-helix domain-containing protein n=1 Tax=Streptomyces sp. NPDC051987 TaxID=3155808 RepID=UPI003420512D